jgi:DNA-directed RNA polymerase beta subunit
MSQEILKQLYNMHNMHRTNTLLNTNVLDTTKQILQSIETKNGKLIVDDIYINKKNDDNDVSAQKSTRNKGQTWADEVRANLKLVDKESGKVLDTVKNIKIVDIPKVTERDTFIVGGNEYNITKQSRLKPGVYTTVKNNGEIKSFINVDKTIDFERGFNSNSEISFNPENKIFTLSYGTKNIPLISALRAVGATDSEMKDKWGEDAFKANDDAKGKYTIRDQIKLYEAIFGKKPDATSTHEKMCAEIKDRLFSTELDPDTTKITLGKGYKDVEKGVFLDASKKIIDINKGEVKPDDREAMVFKSFHGIEDYVKERLIKNAKRIQFAIGAKLNRTNSINQSISTQSFNPYVHGTITSSQLSNPPSQTNVMTMLGDATKLTVMGEGGIGSPNAITNDTRQISNTEVGFIDPLHTPEGSNIGVTVHTTTNSVKFGNDLYGRFKTVKGDDKLLRPIDVYDKNVAFYDQYNHDTMKPKEDKVKVVYKGELKEVSPKEVDYILPNTHAMFDTDTNMIPFLGSISGNRGLTAAKMQEQARPLKYREERLVDIKTSNGKSLDVSLASTIGLPKSPINGVVKKINKDNIVITGNDKKDVVVPIYHNYSLNGESFLHNEPVIKEGDSVKTGDLLADNNFTRNGRVAIGTNLRVAYMPYRGYNYEDSAIISESAAKKLTSLHMYDFSTKRSSDGVYSKNKFKAYFPEEVDSKKLDKLDIEGIVQPGQVVHHGDILIAHMEKKLPTADDVAVGRLDKQRKLDMANNSVKWEKDVDGVVTDVTKHGNSVVVSVKTEEPLKVADKISGLHGNKHIISKIVPDHEMPYDPKTNEYIDLTMSPIGMENRANPSQNLEAAAGKWAKATGKKYEIQNFDGKDNTREVLEKLKEAGLSDKDVLIDPQTQKPFLNPIANGWAHILKLEHIVDHKFSARYTDGYDANEQPLSGGHTGGKNIGRMEFAALQARGAKENLREMFSLKGQRNDEYWRAMEMGDALPPPKRAFVWEKMLAMMYGSGINVEQRNKEFVLKPITDKDILSLSKGEIKDPTLTYRRKDLAPMKNGLYDPIIAGGIHGEEFTHFKLPEKILNPITEAATANLLDMSSTHLQSIIKGKTFVDKKTGELVDPGSKNSISGGPAVELLLSKIDTEQMLKDAQAVAEKTRNPSELNKMHKRIRYLKAFEQNGTKPTDYLISNVLVVPSKFRPMYAMGPDKTVIMSDVNDLYQQAGMTVNAFKDLKNEVSSVKDKDVQNVLLADVRGSLYDDVKAITGLSEPTAYLHKIKNKKGFISQIDGGKEKQTKEGFYQDKVLERRQDLVGRSTIILNPNLKGDEIGMPKDMATQLYRPFIMQKLVTMGYKPLEAADEIKKNTEVFQRARQLAVDERPVIANRAPTLHQWNMTAAKPILVEGKSIEMPAVIISRNLGGDFDGDAVQLHVPISVKAVQEAEKMKPSSSMLKIGYGTSLNAPAMDITTGAWLVSKGKGGKNTKLKFDSFEKAQDEFKNNKFECADIVTINGKKAPYGMHVINSALPDDVKKWDIELNQKAIDNWIVEATTKHGGTVGLSLADKMKDVGNEYVTRFGYTLGPSDFITKNEIRDKRLKEAEKKVDKKNPISVITTYADAKEKAIEDIKKEVTEDTMQGIGMKSGGSKGMSNIASISLMPSIVMDANDKPIPIPITKSLAEGFDTFSYWAAAHGARGGNIKKSVQSYRPGWLTKDLMNSIYDTTIKTDEPMDSEGLEYSISDNKGIINRYLARDVKDSNGKIVAKRNELISSDVVNKIEKSGVKNVYVQSPITDPTPGDGFSSYSYGVKYDGTKYKPGDAIGIVSAHTITEPAVNMAMKAFHTGGAYDPNKRSFGTQLDMLERILRFTTNNPDKATFGGTDGKVKSIEKSSVGGYDVVIEQPDGHEEVRYIMAGNEPTVKTGEKVKKGDVISTGTPSPHDSLKYRGMKETQKFLVNELDRINEGKLDKRNLETIVRGISNTTRVINPGAGPWSHGDVAPLTAVEYFNNNNLKEVDIEDSLGNHLAEDYKGFKKHQKIDENIAKELDAAGVKRVNVYLDRIKHQPFLTPAGIGAKAQSSEDFIARLGHNRIRSVLEEGTTQRWKSTMDPVGNLIPQYVTGEYTW